MSQTYDMQITGNGANSADQAQVDPSVQALRVSLRPTEFNYGSTVGGHYSVGGMTGLMAAGIASLAEVFQVRWADPTKIFLLEKLIVQFSTATGFAATTVGAPCELILGHSSTANGSGGAAIAPNSISNRARNTMSPSAFVTSGGIRIATTGTLTAATGQVLEPASIAACMGADNRTLVSTSPFILWDQTSAGDYPLVLQQGDSMAIRTVSPAATGTWYMSLCMSWIEATNY